MRQSRRKKYIRRSSLCGPVIRLLFFLVLLLLPGSTAFPVSAGEEALLPDAREEEEVHIGGGYAVTGQLSDVGYMAKLYDATNGLPTSEANCVLGASDGYVWIGGYSGIIRYDGNRFERLPASTGLTNGRALFEDSSGRIWVGTNDNGVVVMDGPEYIHFSKEDGLGSSSIRCFAEDASGNVYIASTAGVCRVDRDMKLHAITDERIRNERVLRLVTDAGGTVYGQTRNGAVFSLSGDLVRSYCESEDMKLPKITTILADPEKSGKLYFATEGKFMYYGTLGMDASSMQKISTDPLEDVHWLSYDCGRVWVSSITMAGYLDEDGHLRRIRELPMTESIEMMCSDYQGNMWYASSRQGVMKLISNNFRDYSSAAGLTKEVVNTTCLYRGNLYVGTDNGLHIINGNGRSIDNRLSALLSHTRIRHIFADSRDRLWVSTFTGDKGLVCMEADGTIRSYTTEEGMPDNEVRCCFESKDGYMIAGTNQGVAIVDEGKVVRTIGADEGMSNTVILTVCEMEDGRILAGSDGDGIYVIDGTDVRRIGTEQGLTSDVIMRIRRDKARDLYWIITSNSVEYMKGDQITAVSSFPYNNNFDILEAKNDRLWVMCSQGLYSVKGEEMLADEVTDYRLYTVANGLTSIPISHCYCEMDSMGNLYIAGQSGVCKVNVEHFFEASSRVRARVVSILCDEEEILPDESGTYTIAADVARVQITPAVLDYTVSNPTVRVFLEGADDPGITTEQSRLSTLEYTGLKYGNYTLHIQIIDRGSGKALSDETFSIRKKPMFYELLFVKILMFLVLLAAGGIFVWRVLAGTIIRKQYSEIREAREEADRANMAKSRFLANMSHEIRTPINTIMGMDEMILREDATDVPRHYFLSMVTYALDIRGATESLLGLINDLLDISKIESGKMHLVEQEYDSVNMLRSVITMIRGRADTKKLYFDVEIDEELPKRLYGDEGKIKQIILNLLTNAVKYTDEGGFTLKCEVSKKTELSCALRISVKDTGIGVKPEDLDKLFTAYERLDEEKNSAIQGTGLGLDISRQFAELMKGKLWCESEYGEGSEFILTLDQKIVDAEGIGVFREEDDSMSRGPYVPQFIAPDADILVVDDNPMNLSVIKGLLKSTEVFVTTAESGEECLEKLKSGSFNVVFLDHMMPGMDGIETVAKIRESWPDLPVYALTANAVSGGEEFYRSKGFDGYLTKPIDSMALEHTIMKHLPEDIMMKPSEAEAAVEESDVSEELHWLHEVEGLSVEEGIRHSGGVASFVSSLYLFLDTMDGMYDTIKNAYQEEDIRLYTVKVHALKSSARIIGAMELSAFCQKLEDAGNREDMELIRENTDKLLADYAAFREKLSRLPKEGDAEDKPEIAEDELKDAFGALRELIPMMDADGVEMVLEQLKSYKLPDGYAEKTAELEKKLKVFDWDAMEALIG
ncbi:MAG: response regulator [Lachnospiraceae bacterium]|nr:response regulator [Lachnospiraceae bacterium]